MDWTPEMKSAAMADAQKVCDQAKRIAELEAIIDTAGALASQKASHDMIIDALCGRLVSQSKP